MNVLVVDDKSLIVRDVIRSVERNIEGAVCDGFSRSSEALEHAKENKVDVAILDVDMPDINGIDLAEKLEEINPRVNIIFITGHQKYAIDSYKVKASDFILKPFDDQMIKDAFEKLRFPIDEIEKLGADRIGENITRYRKESNISIEKLGQVLGCSYQTVYRWEKGDRTPDVYMMVEIAKALNVTVDYLMK